MNPVLARERRASVRFVAIAVVVLAIAMTGSATAAVKITGKQIKNGTVTTADIKNGNLGAKDLSPAVIKMLSGKVGPRGAPGVAGLPGAKGDQGDPGVAGAKGDQGEQGVAGTPGEAGAPGVPGAAGPKGDPGEAGIPGEKGEAGTPGEAGAPGVPGAPGAKGDQGDPGTPGASGISGYHVVRSESEVLPGATRRLAVTCPAGETAISGGGVWSGDDATIAASFPFYFDVNNQPGPAVGPETNTWIAAGKNTTVQTATLFAYVVCGHVQ